MIVLSQLPNDWDNISTMLLHTTSVDELKLSQLLPKIQEEAQRHKTNRHGASANAARTNIKKGPMNQGWYKGPCNHPAYTCKQYENQDGQRSRNAPRPYNMPEHMRGKFNFNTPAATLTPEQKKKRNQTNRHNKGLKKKLVAELQAEVAGPSGLSSKQKAKIPKFANLLSRIEPDISSSSRFHGHGTSTNPISLIDRLDPPSTPSSNSSEPLLVLTQPILPVPVEI